MPANQTTNRDRVLQGLSTDEWRDCYDVAAALSWTPNEASKMLADVYRDERVYRREAEDPTPNTNVEYEYTLK